MKPYELLAKYILYDEIYGNLDWKEIIKLLFENDEASECFMQVLEYTPRLELFEFLDRYYGKIKVIIVSRGSKEEIEQFLKKWKLDRYIDQIYGKAKKWSEVFWKNLNLPKRSVVIGDKLYDLIVPMFLGYKTVLFNQFDDIREILYEMVS